MVGFNYSHFGSFTMDIGTVYKQRGSLNNLLTWFLIFEIIDHEYYHKWVPIIGNEEFIKEEYVTYKGYVKCDLSVQSLSDNFQVTKKLFLFY
jgi:hypothetical protein